MDLNFLLKSSSASLGKLITFISKDGDNKKASCYSRPEIESRYRLL